MGRLVPIVLRSWALPFIVLALIAPAVAAFALTGPQLGLAVGALTVGVVIVLAARAHFDEPIEVATAPDARYRLLVLASDPLDDPGTVARIKTIVSEGASSPRHAGAGDPEVLVLAPATQRTLDRWATDLGPARADASDRLVVSLAAFAAAGLEATGRIGDGNAVQALEDELHEFPADEVAVVSARRTSAHDVEEIRRRLDRPVRAMEPSKTSVFESARSAEG